MNASRPNDEAIEFLMHSMIVNHLLDFPALLLILGVILGPGHLQVLSNLRTVVRFTWPRIPFHALRYLLLLPFFNGWL